MQADTLKRLHDAYMAANIGKDAFLDSAAAVAQARMAEAVAEIAADFGLEPWSGTQYLEEFMDAKGRLADALAGMLSVAFDYASDPAHDST